MITTPNITSTDNPLIKDAKKLHQKKFREEFGSFLVENLTLIADAAASNFVYTSLFVTEECIEKNDATLGDIVFKTGIPYTIINNKVNDYLSQLDNPAGVYAVYKIPESKPLESTNTLYLNNINDPGNVGTMIRSATAFGVTQIILDETCADVYNNKTIMAAKDGIFKVSFLHDSKDRALWKQLGEQMPRIVTTMTGTPDLSCLHKHPLCLVLGSETHGVTEQLQQEATARVRIPIDHIESLNVAATAAICLYEMNKGA